MHTAVLLAPAVLGRTRAGAQMRRRRFGRAVTRGDLVVDEVEPRRVRIALFVDEPDLHDAVLGRLRPPHVLEVRLLVDVEVRVDGLIGHYGGQHDGSVDQVARRHDRARDAARDRRRDAREREVQLGRFERGADRCELRRGNGEFLMQWPVRVK